MEENLTEQYSRPRTYIIERIESRVIFLCSLTAELALKARKEIADYINNGKEERARIRVSKLNTLPHK